MPVINLGKDAIKHFIFLGILAFFGFITINHFWRKPVEKNAVVHSSMSSVPVHVEEEIIPRAMTVAEHARYLQEIDETITERCEKLEKDFGIAVNGLMGLREEREVAYRFIQSCYRNPAVAKEIASSLQGVQIMFGFWHDISVGAGYVSFPSTDKWANPENVLAYLKSSYKK